jgi:hypothetical protein
MPRVVANHSAAQLDAFLRRGGYAYPGRKERLEKLEQLLQAQR